MLRNLFNPITVVLLSGGLLFTSLRAAESSNTHFARIPAGADLSTIRFEKVRLVKVASGIRYTTDAQYCTEQAFRDPGGSIACPSAQTDASVPAYEVTYSFTGQPLASDEYAGRNFTFSVYFALNDLTPEMQKALSARKLSRSDAAAFFRVSTHRETQTRAAIDDEQSTICEGNYVDGMWAHIDAGCKDIITYTTVTTASDYITVQVNSPTSRTLRARLVSAK